MTTFLLASQCREDCLPWREGRDTAEVEKDAEACRRDFRFFVLGGGRHFVRQSARSRRSILHSLASSRNLRRSVTLSGGERSMKRTPGRRREGERAGESLKPPSDRRRLRRRRDSLCSLSLVSRCCRQQLLLLSSSISGAPVSDTERRLLVFLPRAWRLAAREGETEKGGEEQRKVISERHRLFFFAFVVDFLFRRRQIFSTSS